MTSDRWQRLEELFHRAQSLPTSERAAFLDGACGDEPGLRADVERLLRASERAGNFIETPATANLGASIAEASDAGRRIGAYRVVREIGRGGMGAVYLAERDDGAFQQRVAIKLIKRGMDTDQVLARFRAERQILATLDHPNIARLLDGGTTDDGLPYFAMEYIEGQPIDAYAEAQQLDIEGRLHLFLPVCAAVAYAHDHGVIHRDIKPLNTLVTASGAPRLLDFGIAKVLGDSGDGATETVTGLRLLTPDYASPEQVEGRRATTASDVYSLGVMLYELLTGRSPYRVTSRSPSDIAHAVCATEPEAPSTAITVAASEARVRHSLPGSSDTAAGRGTARQLSRRLRGDLDTIILTALRKEPTRRYASVVALAEDIQRHLAGQPIRARGDDVGYRVARFARRNRTALVAGASGLAVLAAAWSGLLPGRGAPGEPTLLATRSLALRDRVVVADFADRSGDPALAEAITEALRTDLSQSAVVRVLTPRQVRNSLTMMQSSPDVALNDSLARELSLREGVKAFVTGSVAQVSGAYTISVQLVAAQSGEALAGIRETARDSSGVIAAVDRASKALRERIGESLRDLEQSPSLAQATTASLAALRLYSEAQRLVRQGNRTGAVQRFTEATRIDTAFASAHLGLAMAYGAMADAGRSQLAGERALAHQERLPFLERNVLRASQAYARQDHPEAMRAYREILARYPDHLASINNLALVYREDRQFAVAESLFRRGAEVDSTVANLLYGLHSTQVLQGKFAEASATLQLLNRRFPNHPIYLTEVTQDAAAQQQWDRAAQTAWEQIRRAGSDTLQLVDPFEALAQIAMVRGHLKEAERLWVLQARTARASATMGRYLFGVLQRGYLQLRYERDTARAIALVDAALRETPLDSLLPGDRRHDEVARFYLSAGARQRVGPLLAAAVATDSILHRTIRTERMWTTGLVALADGKVTQAVGTLQAVAERHPCTICVLPDLARAYERAGKPQDAARTYKRYLTTPWVFRYEVDATELGAALQRLSAISEQLGDSATARDARTQLEALWRDADRRRP